MSRSPRKVDDDESEKYVFLNVYFAARFILSSNSNTAVCCILMQICVVSQISISANANGPSDAASSKINHITLPTRYNYQAMSVGR